MVTITVELTEPELWRIQSALNRAKREYVQNAEDWRLKGRDDRAEIATGLAAEVTTVGAKLHEARRATGL